MIFNNGSKSKSKSRSKSKSNVTIKPKSPPENLKTGSTSEPLTASTTDNSNTKLVNLNNVLLKLSNRFQKSSFIALFSKLNFKNPKTLQSFYQLSLQISLLFFKAYLTLKLATLDGNLVSSLISRRFKQFFKFLLFWLLIGIPTSITDSLLEKSKRLLSQSIRINLTTTLLDDYLPSNGNSTIYQLLNSKTSSISDPNHRLTTTVEHFADSFSILPSQLLTPILDILIAANHMSKSSENSSEGALLLGLVANVSTLILKFFTPNFSILNNMRNTLENKFHEFHSNIITNNEEIALAKGHSREIDLLDTSYFEYERFERMTLRRMAVYNFAISFIFKYTLGAFGLLLCAVPTFTSAYITNFVPTDELISQLSSDFVANRSLLLKASDSLGKLIQSKKNIQNMTGYADEIWDFEKELIDINESSKLESLINGIQNISSVNLDSSDLSSSSALQQQTQEQPLLVGPNVSYGDEISFTNVPLITPNGNVLVENLTFTIKPGDNLLIIGPNGCGKSSLFRILGGLWDVKDPGKLVVPYDKRDLFYLPQRSYFTYGTLREQIIYPDSYDEYRNKILKARQENPGSLVNDDEYLIELLRKVNLEYLLDFDNELDENIELDLNDFNNNNNGGNKTCSTSDCVFMIPCLDRVEKWPDLLSVGEQQRLAMIRLYYHKPKFAVLDECTSSISSDLERECYRIATEELKITVISVCHRTSLWSFHSKILKFKRTGDCEGKATALFTGFDPELRLKRHEELISIDCSLKRNDELNKRLNALKNMKNSRSGRRQALMYIGDDD